MSARQYQEEKLPSRMDKKKQCQHEQNIASAIQLLPEQHDFRWQPQNNIKCVTLLPIFLKHIASLNNTPPLHGIIVLSNQTKLLHNFPKTAKTYRVPSKGTIN